MNRILATILATLNALLGFVLIFGSIWFAKFMYEQIATKQIAAGIVIAAYSCGAIAFLARIEGHLKAIKEQG
jgi:Ca2+/H+ antiporter